MKKKILIIAHNEFEDTELVATRDVLLRKGIDVDLISMSNDVNIVSAYNLKIKCDNTIKNIFNNLDRYDALFIPGGSGVKNIDETKYIDEIIKYFILNKKIIGTICAAPTLLAKRGFLKNKNATCFSDDGLIKVLKDGKAKYLNKEVVIDGNIITGRDMKSSIEFGRELSNLILKK